MKVRVPIPQGTSDDYIYIYVYIRWRKEGAVFQTNDYSPARACIYACNDENEKRRNAREG